MISCTASGIVMKYRLIRGSVTVTGPPAAIWRRKIGTTEPEEPSTLPKRTVAYLVAGIAGGRGLDRPLGQRLGGAHHGGRLDRLVGRDEHERAHAGLAGDPGDQPRGERVVAHRLDRVQLHHRHVLVGGGVEDDRRAVLGEHLPHPLLLLAVGEHRDGRAHVAVLLELAHDLEQVVLGVVDQHQPARADPGDLAAQLRRRSSRRRR